MTIEEIKSKMKELENKWSGVPESTKYSSEWFKRRIDRSHYVKLQFMLKESERSQRGDSNAEKIAKQVGLI